MYLFGLILLVLNTMFALLNVAAEDWVFVPVNVVGAWFSFRIMDNALRSR